MFEILISECLTGVLSRKSLYTNKTQAFSHLLLIYVSGISTEYHTSEKHFTLTQTMSAGKTPIGGSL